MRLLASILHYLFYLQSLRYALSQIRILFWNGEYRKKQGKLVIPLHDE